MSVTVRILPSAREFLVEGEETILEAGLRLGLALPHRCSNGSCGECLARVVTGRARGVRFHDYALSERERERGYVLMCASTADTDLELEVQEVGVEQIPFQEIRAKVQSVEHLREDVALLRLRTPRSTHLVFRPGQYLRLVFPGLLPRYRSIASCPCDGERLEFHVRRFPGDAFAEYVFTTARAGQPVLLSGPEGRFTLDEQSKRPILFFAYDTGFAPIKSLIEHALAADSERAAHLYWLALDESQHYLENLCRAWTDAFDGFRYTPLSSRGPGPGGAAGWQETEALEQVLRDYPDLSAHDVYIASPQALLAAAWDRFRSHGLAPERLFAESQRYF